MTTVKVAGAEQKKNKAEASAPVTNGAKVAAEANGEAVTDVKRKRKRNKTIAADGATTAARHATKPKAPRGEPKSGQSGKPTDLYKARLNAKELLVVGVLHGDANPFPINALATNCFSDQTASKANSWVRNCLRRLVRGKWVEKTGKGTYILTDHGKERFEKNTPIPKELAEKLAKPFGGVKPGRKKKAAKAAEKATEAAPPES
jgi:hypothetical protein